MLGREGRALVAKSGAPFSVVLRVGGPTLGAERGETCHRWKGRAASEPDELEREPPPVMLVSHVSKSQNTLTTVYRISKTKSQVSLEGLVRVFVHFRLSLCGL